MRDIKTNSVSNLEMSKSERIRIIEQARMLVNEQSNENGFSQNISDSYRIFAQLLKQYGSGPEFQESMTNSHNLFEKKIDTLKLLNKLESDKTDSFLLLPIGNKDNLFTCLIRKMTENNQECYSAIIANMGERSNHPQFHEYMFKNATDIFCPLAITRTGFYVSQQNIDKIYEVFKDFSMKQYSQNLISRGQIVNNCFIKEVEKGIKLATIPVEVLKTTRNTEECQKPLPIKFSINGNKIPTEKIHCDYLNILKQENPWIADELESIRKSYVLNKSFRDYIQTGKIISCEDELSDIAKNLSYKSLEFCLRHPMKSIGLGVVNLETNPQIAYTIREILGSLAKINEGINSYNKNGRNFFNNTVRELKNTDFKEKYPYLEKQLNQKVSQVYFKEARKYHITHPQKALDYYTKALEFDPENSSLAQNKGRISYRLEDYLTACENYEFAFEINPCNTTLINDLSISYLTLGMEHIEGNSINAGLEYMNKALKVNPINKELKGGIFYEIAEVYFKECDFEKALDFYKKAEPLCVSKSVYHTDKMIEACERELFKYKKIISNEIPMRN